MRDDAYLMICMPVETFKKIKLNKAERNRDRLPLKAT